MNKMGGNVARRAEPARITQAPAADLVKYRLAPRQAMADTCGFEQANYYSPRTCDYPELCAVNTINAVWGCCNVPIESCYIATTCYNSGLCDEDCQANSYDGYCGSSAYPYCQKITSTRSGQVLSGFVCARISSSADYMAEYPTNGPYSSIGPVTPVIVTNYVTHTAPVPTPSQTTHSGGLSTGAKAGIGVGASVGALAVLGVIFFVMRNRSRRVSPHPGPPMVQHAHGAPYMSPPPSSVPPMSPSSGYSMPKHFSTVSEGARSNI